MIATIFIPLLFYVLFSGMEVSYVSLDRIRFFSNREEKTKGFIHSILSLFHKNSDRFLLTLLTGNAVSLLVYGILSIQIITPIAKQMIDNTAFIITFQLVISVSFFFVVAEFLPKILFRIDPHSFVRIFALPIVLFYYLLYPVVWLFTCLSRLFFKLLGLKIVKGFRKHPAGKGYLDYLIQHSINDFPEDSNVETEVKLFQNALDFSSVKLRNCMVPRTEIVSIDKSCSIDELKSLFIETGLSKIIVYEDDLDNIIGYIHSSEMFKGSADWGNSINQIPIVPETMAAINLMNVLMQEKKSIAVVVDEFGGTAGIVTLEDIVEEIFGDIEDEHDSRSFLAKKIGMNEYIFAGRNEISKINEQFGLNLPESEEYVTLAGLILEHHQSFPIVNEEIQFGKYSFRIVRLSATKIELIKVSVNPEKS